jgi:hypothetical protein
VKPFIIGLYAVFIFAMISGLTIAYRNAEGLVEPDYYLKQNDWFRQKGEEKRIGLDIEKPASIRQGSNELTFVLTEQGKPLSHADVKLFVGNVSNKEHDHTIAMRETAPGTYTAQVSVPGKGKLLVRLDLAAPKLKTSRSWFYEVN